MKFNIFFNFLFAVYVMLSPGQAKSLEIALSFDDAPTPSGPIFSSFERTNRLIRALKEKQVEQVAFFCSNLQNFYSEDRQRLKMYAEAGHILANHTASHLDLRAIFVNTNKFIADIHEADRKLSIFSNYRRWFRYPYLRQSTGIITADNNRDVEVYLAQEKYKHGYITIETYDWYLNKLIAIDTEKEIKLDYQKIKQAYISMLWDSIIFYDNLAKEVLNGRSPKHVILLHENDINSLFIADLMDYIRDKGGKIITIEEAYSDPISDSSFDGIAYSQRRIRAIARYKNYKNNMISTYEDQKNIDKLYHAVVKS